MREPSEDFGEPTRITPASPHSRRPVEEAEAKDLAVVMSGLTYALTRERARADQLYSRARNMLSVALTVFGAVQAGFLAAIDKSTSSQPIVRLMSQAERLPIYICAAVAGLFLLTAVGTLLFGADRSWPQAVLSSDDIDDALFGQSEAPMSPSHAIVGYLQGEERSWASVNTDRDRLALTMAWLCMVAVACAVAELGLILMSLR